MSKIFQLILITFLLSSCGYKPLLQNKNYDFSFANINIAGNKKITQVIKNSLIENTSSTSVKNYQIFIEAENVKETISTNSKGDPTVFKILVSVDYILEEDGKNIFKNTITRHTTYNNINDKFELLKYEENILKILSQGVSSEILISIASLIK